MNETQLNEMQLNETQPKIGVLALQGDFEAHIRALDEIGVPAEEVRDLADLSGLNGLIIPGGESTTLLKILREEGMEAIRQFSRSGGVILGTCAGLILLAREVQDPAQASLGLLDAVVSRNAYGRQVESFHTVGSWELGGSSPLEMTFIRAPRIRSFGNAISVLARYQGEPVLIRQGRILGATFHPELAADRSVHELFVKLVRESMCEDGGVSKEDAESCPR